MIKQKLAVAAALFALIQPQAAMAKACVKQEDLADAMVYVMPVAYDAFTSKCATKLSDDGFVAREGDAFIAKYAALHDQTWDGAYGFLKTFMDKGAAADDPMLKMFDDMPAETIQPFVDAIIKMKLSEEIKIKDCVKIEQILEPLAPLPPENLGMLVSRVVALMPERREPNICPLESK